MTLKAHYLQAPAPRLLAELQRQLEPEVQLTTGLELPNPADFEILIATRVTRQQLEASPRLRALINLFTGVSEETLVLLGEFPHIALHNSHHPAASTAEMALALLLAAARWLVPADRNLRTGDWTIRDQTDLALVLEGKTLLVLGYGQIGQRVAKVCQALGMKVVAIRQKLNAPLPLDISVELHPASDLRQVLPRANVLMVTLPLTPETRGLIGAAELALLPKGAVLVNVGRGPIVDEEALYKALRDKTLGAAGVDVWYTYPADAAARTHTFPSKYPFQELDNVVLSPHRGGWTVDSEQLGVATIASMLNAAARGEPLPNRVDVAAGY
jgi:phosphoglycerate dehydrogenase-like enzyme